jgi:hypothetical protein
MEKFERQIVVLVTGLEDIIPASKMMGDEDEEEEQEELEDFRISEDDEVIHFRFLGKRVSRCL